MAAPFIRGAKCGGWQRTANMCEFVNAIFYAPSTGHHWQAIPRDLPSKSTVWGYFFSWELEGTIARTHHALCFAVRERAGRVVRPTIAIITVRRRTSRKKRGHFRPIGLRRGQEDPQSQTLCSDRHHGPAARCGSAPGPCASSRRCCARRDGCSLSSGQHPTLPDMRGRG